MVSYGKPQIIILAYKVAIKSHLEYGIRAWVPSLKKDVVCLESVEQVGTRMGEGQKSKWCMKVLKDPMLYSAGESRFRAT